MIEAEVRVGQPHLLTHARMRFTITLEEEDEGTPSTAGWSARQDRAQLSEERRVTPHR